MPIEISYPDVPEVPEKIQGPSAPIKGAAESKKGGGGWFSWGKD
jgi:hypothetical protein